MWLRVLHNANNAQVPEIMLPAGQMLIGWKLAERGQQKHTVYNKQQSTKNVNNKEVQVTEKGLF